MKVYILTVVIFITAKLVFMLVNYEGHAFAIGDVCDVVLHGLSLDLSTSLYILILPFLITMVSLWWNDRRLQAFLRIYYAVIATMLMLTFVADTSLYPFWGFKLDVSCLQYLETPSEVKASVSGFYMAVCIVLQILGSYGLYRLYKALLFIGIFLILATLLKTFAYFLASSSVVPIRTGVFLTGSVPEPLGGQPGIQFPVIV